MVYNSSRQIRARLYLNPMQIWQYLGRTIRIGFRVRGSFALVREAEVLWAWLLLQETTWAWWFSDGCISLPGATAWQHPLAHVFSPSLMAHLTNGGIQRVFALVCCRLPPTRT